MKRFGKIFILLAVLGAVFYHFEDQIFSRIFSVAPCSKPVVYTLGAFDERFNISKKYFLNALLDAEAVWEKPQGDFLGKDLFVYKPESANSSDLKINLVYDYREEATNKLQSLGIGVKNSKVSYNALKAKLLLLKSEYENKKSSFGVQVADFNSKQHIYESEVSSWNQKGGAPRKEYDRLNALRLALESESKELQNKQTGINGIVDEINALVVVLNSLAGSLNLSVEKYNTINSSRGESFEEGVYASDGLSREIDIYEFSDREKLVRVLAHELGHALGIAHVVDPKAIMYELNKGNNEKLTKADLDALKLKCQEK